MPVITAIKPQKNKKRVNIYLDDKFGFGIDLENFVKLGLKVEQELSDEEIAAMVKKAELQKTLDKLLRFSSLRPRSEKEITGWLRKKKVHESLNGELFNRLKRLELVDDVKFAKWWVGQRMEFRPKSRKELVYELRLKGIGKEVIEEVMGGMEMSDEATARKLLAKKTFGDKKKMAEYLLRRGFDWGVVKKVQ